jgi:hypothetical protein
MKICYQSIIDFDTQEVKTSLEKKFTPGKNLISFESLAGDVFHKFINTKLIADRLSGLFPQAKIIVTIRNQYDLIMSIYKQFIHQGGSISFRDFINYKDGKFNTSYDIHDHTVNLRMFNFLKFIQYYERLFGRKNLYVVPFELLEENATLFVSRVLRAMGIKNIPVFQNVRYNPGYGVRQITIARFLNRFFKSPFNQFPLIPDVELPRVGKLDSQLIRRALQSRVSFKLLGQKPIKDSVVEEEIKSVFSESNRALNQAYNLSLKKKYFKGSSV